MTEVVARVLRAMCSPDIPNSPLAGYKLPGDAGFGSYFDHYALVPLEQIAQAAIAEVMRG